MASGGGERTRRRTERIIARANRINPNTYIKSKAPMYEAYRKLTIGGPKTLQARIHQSQARRKRKITLPGQDILESIDE